MSGRAQQSLPDYAKMPYHQRRNPLFGGLHCGMRAHAGGEGEQYCMETMTGETFAAVLALVGLVIMIAALFSGLIERSNLPQVAVFLALGAALGPAGLGFVNIGLD